MNYDTTIKALEKLELDEITIKTYLELLKTPPISITQIAINLGTYRRKIYESLQKLEDIGLVEKQDQIILPKSPVILKSLLKSKQYEINKITSDYEEILPDLLTNFYREGIAPNIRIFDGANKFQYLYNTILDEISTTDQILSYNEGDDLYRIMDYDYFFQHWIQKRIKKGLHIKILLNHDNSKIPEEIKKDEQELKRKMKVLPNSIKDKGCYWIAGSKIILWDTATPKAILIENVALSNLFRNQFNLVWELL